MGTYGATKELLHDWSTTKKFMVLKAPLILIILQDLLISWLLDVFAHDEILCGNVGRYLWPEDPHESLGRFWGRWLTTIECIGLALLVKSAYPAEDIVLISEEKDLSYKDLVLDLEEQKASQEDLDSNDSSDVSGADDDISNKRDLP